MPLFQLRFFILYEAPHSRALSLTCSALVKVVPERELFSLTIESTFSNNGFYGSIVLLWLALNNALMTYKKNPFARAQIFRVRETVKRILVKFHTVIVFV